MRPPAPPRCAEPARAAASTEEAARAALALIDMAVRARMRLAVVFVVLADALLRFVVLLNIAPPAAAAAWWLALAKEDGALVVVVALVLLKAPKAPALVFSETQIVVSSPPAPPALRWPLSVGGGEKARLVSSMTAPRSAELRWGERDDEAEAAPLLGANGGGGTGDKFEDEAPAADTEAEEGEEEPTAAADDPLCCRICAFCAAPAAVRRSSQRTVASLTVLSSPSFCRLVRI